MKQLDIFSWFFDYCKKLSSDPSCEIRTIDNPGFFVSVNLKKCELINKQFTPTTIERSEHDWVHCFIRNEKFEGYCGPINLLELLLLFKNWVTYDVAVDFNDNNLQWLMCWYAKHCDGSWEHNYGIQANLLADGNCYLNIDLTDTECENDSLEFQISEKQACFHIQDKKFFSICDPLNLSDRLHDFRKLTEEHQEKSTSFLN